MKRFVTILTVTVFLALGMAGPALAACTTHTYVAGGRMLTCTTCCVITHCTTTCI